MSDNLSMLLRMGGSSVVLALLIAACGLDVSGSGSDPDSPDAGVINDSSAPQAESGITVPDAADDAALEDVRDTGPLVDGPSGCPTLPTGALIVPAARPVTIDGDLNDWECASFTKFDITNAQLIAGSQSNVPNTYTFAITYDASNIYVAIKVTDPQPNEGNNSVIYNNDSIEVYLADSTAGGYTPRDHQYQVDWNNRRWDYNGGENTGKATNAVVLTSVKSTGSASFNVEMKIPATELGRTTFKSGDKLGFAIAGADSDGTRQTAWILWRRPQSCSAGGCCEPFCSTRFIEEMTLR